jgi:hypothetical protein
MTSQMLELCSICQAPNDEDGDCTDECDHTPETQASFRKQATAARLRKFLALADDMPDREPMWMVGGIALTWGDLRVLTDYDLLMSRQAEGEG